MNGMNALIAQGVVPQESLLLPSQLERNALTTESARMNLEDQKMLRPMKNEIAQMAYLRDVGQTVTWENYPAFYEHAITKIGLRPTQLPDPQQVAQMGPEAFEKSKLQNLTTLDQKLKVLMQEEKLRSAEDLVGQKIESAEKVSGERISAAEKLSETRHKQLTELAEVRAKHAAELAELKASLKPEKPEKEKYTKEDTLIVDALREEKGSEPTASEVLQKKKQIAREVAGERRSHVLPEKAMDNMSGALDSMRLIDELAGVADEAMGIPGLGQAKMWLKSKAGSDKAQLFLNNLRQLKINAQSLIKGIPSNFDVQTFINSLPKEDDTPKEVKTKVEIARKMLEDALITGMQNYEKQYEIPEYMRERYEAANIKGSLTPEAKKTIRYDAQGNRVE